MSAPLPLRLLCAGAARGLVRQTEEDWLRAGGATIDGRFGAVGTMKEALLAGAPCDVMVTTAAMVSALQASGELRAGTEADLGRVYTGIAVRAADPRPDVPTPAALRAALLAAPAIHFPDPERATAGIHFASVLRKLGVADDVASRCRTFPNGATAMRALGDATQPGAIGCTQITEIIDTPGVVLVGALPIEFALATVYTAAIATGVADPALAARFIAAIAGPATRALRERCGFELDPSHPSGDPHP